MPNDILAIITILFIIVLMIIAVEKPTIVMTLSSVTVGSLGAVVCFDALIGGQFLPYLTDLITDGVGATSDGGKSFLPCMIAWGVLAAMAFVTQQYMLGPDAVKSSSRAAPAIYKVSDQLGFRRLRRCVACNS